MKKILSLALASLMCAAMFASCAPASDQLDPAITVASSDAYANAEWLDNRLDTIPDNVIVGIGSNETYGIDMSNFDADGYILREMNGQVLAFGASEDGLDRAVRKYAKSVEKGIAENLDEVYHEGNRIEKLTIGGHDISEFTVVYEGGEEVRIPGGHKYLTGNAEYAATEMVRLIELATGVNLPSQTEEVSGPMIKIGYLNDGEHGEFGFIYEVKDGNLYINGVGNGNGCANGVYYFLEKECGWKDLLYGDSVLAESDHVDVPDGTGADVSPMFGQMIQPYCSIKYGNFINDRSTASQSYIGVRSTASHAMHTLLEGYDYGTNPCFSDEAIITEATENVLKQIQNVESSVGKENFNVRLHINQIQLGTSDTPNFCYCRDCKKAYNEEGKTYAAIYLRFANSIAQAAEDAGYGGIYYNIFAYNGNNKAPSKTVPHEDVRLTFCTDGTCFVHGLDSGECCRIASKGWDLHGDYQKWTNQMIAGWLKGWAEITDNIIVWYYALDNNLNAFSPLKTMYEDLKFLQELGIDGLFWQCDFEGLGISRIQYQLIMDMQWNPDMTEEEFEAALCETLEDEYGEGWYYIREYLNIWHEAQTRSGFCKTCWGYNLMYTPGNISNEYYAEHYDEMYDLFEKAIPLADTAAQQRWLELCSAHMIAHGSVSGFFTEYEEGDEERLDVLRERYIIMIERLQKHGIDPHRIAGQDNWWHSYAFTLDEQAWHGWYFWMKLYNMEGVETWPEPPDEYTFSAE